MTQRRGKSFPAMLMRCAGFLSACLFLAPAAPASAETLSDADIRALYKQAEDVVRNPSKAMPILKARIDDDYLLVAHTARTLGNTPTQNGEEKLDKKQFLARTAQAYNMIKIEDYQQNLLDIKLSDDKQWGYVSRTTIMRGSLQVNMPNGKSGTAAYTDAEACVDTLALKDGSLRIMRAECKVEIRLAPPQ